MQESWTIGKLIAWTTGYFRDKGLEEARLEAEVLLARALERDRVYLYTHYDEPVNREERERMRGFVQRRVSGEPAAYICGQHEFMSLSFTVNPDVLIPRPDTEILVETVCSLARELSAPSICEVGTGSGAIAVSLAHYLPRARIVATDISSAALEIARVNAQQNGAEVLFLAGDLLTPAADQGPFDFIVANLPYIPESQWEDLPLSVSRHEPRLALLAPGDGLDVYRRLLPQAVEMLLPNGYLCFEIGWDQGKVARQMVRENGGFYPTVELRQDLAGRDRVVIAQKEGGA